MIRRVALGVAACDADHKVREEGGNNRGARIRQYLEGTDPPISIDAPWCAAAVQYWSDVAARVLGIPNPLDAVKHEALVQSYFDALGHYQVTASECEPGDLVLFRFSGFVRWNHIGLVAQPPKLGSSKFWTIEGNTSDQSQRDGDAVANKVRGTEDGYPVCFISWGKRRVEL